MCLVKQVHLGATLFNVLASPSDYDGARTVFVPDPYVGQGVNCRKKKEKSWEDCDNTIFGTPHDSNSGTLRHL